MDGNLERIVLVKGSTSHQFLTIAGTFMLFFLKRKIYIFSIFSSYVYYFSYFSYIENT